MNTSQKQLLKAAEARLMEPTIAEDAPIVRVVRMKVTADEVLAADVIEPKEDDDRDPKVWVERRTASTATIVQGRRDDYQEVAAGSIIGFTATWPAAGSPEVLIRRRGEGTTTIGFRDLVTELKTGQRVETAEDRIRSILGGVYLDTVKMTDAEAAEYRRQAKENKVNKLDKAA